MRINYFYIRNGYILESGIDTSDKNYISHTEDSVTFIDSYIDQDWETQYKQITRTRVFDVIRQKRIENIKDRINELQEQLSTFENSNSYDNYTQLISKKK